MRIDHHAYQRAVRVAGFGFMVQLGIGLTLLLFSLLSHDTAFLFASLFVMLGLLVWLGLIIIFNQEKLERLEALEVDELIASRVGTESVFETAEDEVRVAARRLRIMHKWLMPGISIVLAVALAALAWVMLRYMDLVSDTTVIFRLTDNYGWAVAICLAFSAMSFIVSRFVAGMAGQPAWRNLRGGAAYMVGNALVTLAVAIGCGFRFFKNDEVIKAIAVAIPIFMLVLAAEVLLNFILNLYRPRVAGERPRPAFDSKLLSLFSAPDSLVRSINEAVNYQFGFDVTSSWGYQLLLRSFAWLLALGVVVLVGLNMVQIVEPQEQAVRLHFGRVVGDVHGSGVMWKLPWPIETAEVYDVGRVRELHLTSRQVRPAQVQLWSNDLGQHFDKPLDPFIVETARALDADAGIDQVLLDAGEDEAVITGDVEPEVAAERARIAKIVSLVDAEVVIQYRIRDLLDYLRFSSAVADRRSKTTIRELALRQLALRKVSEQMTTLTIDEVLGARRYTLPETLRGAVQAACDAEGTGVEIVAVDMPLLRPAGEAVSKFEDLSSASQDRLERLAEADRDVVTTFTALVGDPDRAAPVLAEIERYNALATDPDADPAAVTAQRLRAEQTLIRTGGQAAQRISEAERDRWVNLMNARADSSRLRGQLVSYRAAPRLYEQRATMQVYQRAMGGLRKYILGIDPSRVNFDFDLKERDVLLDISDAVGVDQGEPGS